MKYLKLYNLFEQSKVDNTQITKWSDIKDIINVVEDELNFQFKELKITQSSSYTRSRFGASDISTFIFQSREYIPPLYKKDEDIYKWFIEQIVNINKFMSQKSQEIVDLVSDYGVFDNGNTFAVIKFPDLTNVGVLRINDRYEYHFNFKCNVFGVLDWVIKNPEDKKLIKECDVNILIKNLFQYYCSRYYSWDFDILSVFSDSKDKLLSPVKKRDISLPHNLSAQFVIDIIPVFLKKVYNSSGLIFRLKISSYDEHSVINKDRLRGHSIAQETDNVLKELKLDMTWRDIFIIEEN